MPRILLLGANGQVGWELRRSLALLGSMTAADQNQCDLADPDALAGLLHAEAADIIVNAAAYTAVDKAEQELVLAERLNAGVPAQLAEHAAATGALLVHYSTDYVFDGTKAGAYLESDAAQPLSVYGRTKLAGEAAILSSPCRHLLLRTSWVFAARGGNFAKTILRLAAERPSLKIVADQFGAPTSAELLADATAHALRALQAGQAGGLYHLTAAGETSWHGYACFVAEQALARGLALKADPAAIQPIPTEAYPLPAKRPANSRLDCSRFCKDFQMYLPPWQYHVERLLDELCPQAVS